jgi:uncharacterized protein
MRQSTDRRAVRPVGRAGAAVSKMLTRAWSLPPQRNFVGIVRLTGADPLTGAVRVGMIGAAHRFGRGHRLRLQVAGGAHPRFARNPGNGQVEAPAKDFVVTRYSVQQPSALVVSQTDAKAAAHA